MLPGWPGVGQLARAVAQAGRLGGARGQHAVRPAHLLGSADQRAAVGGVAELAAVDRPVAPRAALGGQRPFSHHAPPSSALAPPVRSSSATLVASRRRSSPTSRPSEVVIGELSRSWSTINRAISTIDTYGRKVLGPGRMACS